jgi:AhpD family alkylhydroperoxidase
MKALNLLEYELVALGAAIACDCVPCIEYHIPEARKAGLTDAQILEAVQLADKLKQVPARKVLDTAKGMLNSAQPECGDPDCGCAAASAESTGSCCS